MATAQYSVLPYARWKQTYHPMFPTDEVFSSLAPDVFAYLDSLEIRTVVMESEYIDEDFSAAYSHFSEGGNRAGFA